MRFATLTALLSCVATYVFASYCRCVQIWLQKANKCPCCMTVVVRRIMLPDLPPIDYEQLLGFPMSNGAFLPLERRRRTPRSRFLGLWTFGNRRWNPELFARLRQQALEENERTNAQASSVSDSDELPYSQEFSYQLERSHQIDNMADRTA